MELDVENPKLRFSDISQEAEYNDEWLFKSLKRYKFSNMYEMEYGLSTADWFCDGTSQCESMKLTMYLHVEEKC